jgi:hypothetical protein
MRQQTQVRERRWLAGHTCLYHIWRIHTPARVPLELHAREQAHDEQGVWNDNWLGLGNICVPYKTCCSHEAYQKTHSVFIPVFGDARSCCCHLRACLPPAGAAAAKAATQQALCAALDAGLRLLHPFMPFVTEELWQRLPKTPEQVSAACA